MHREDLHPHMYGLLHEYPNEIKFVGGGISCFGIIGALVQGVAPGPGRDRRCCLRDKTNRGGS